MPALPTSRKIAAGLMLLSGVTHLSQLLVYSVKAADVIGAALFGVLYLLLGAYLFTAKRAALWLAVVWPAIGGSLAVLRILTVRPNPFSLLHIAIDVVVITLCVRLLAQRRQPLPPEGREVA